MSAEDDTFDSWFSGDLAFSKYDKKLGRDVPRLDGQAIAEALAGFALPLSAGRDMDWLAMAVRRALSFTIRTHLAGPARQSNTITRKELERLSTKTSKLGLKVSSGLSDEARLEIWRHALRHWHGEGLMDVAEARTNGDQSDHDRFKAAVAELDWLASFLRAVARTMPSQLPRWTEAEKREIRTERAQLLIPIFLAAFDAPKQWGTAFGDFYQQMVSVAFNEGDIPDFEAIITDARHRHAQEIPPIAPSCDPGV